jgi:SAM-dependent methyltransferase
MDTTKDFLFHMIFPWLYMSNSARLIPATITSAVRSGDWARLYSIDAFRDALFGRFWAANGSKVKSMVEPIVIPLLEGRVSDGLVLEDVVHEPVRGRVIEVGAGTGTWADVFLKISTSPDREAFVGGARQRKATTKGITKIYGIEPQLQSVRALTARVKELGMDAVYEVIPVGIESLSDSTAWAGPAIEPGSIDCIVTVLCLCSIPDQEKNIQALYRLLKPGGRWYVFEHEKFRTDGFGNKLLSLYQGERHSTALGSHRTDWPQHSLTTSGLSSLVHVDCVMRQASI